MGQPSNQNKFWLLFREALNTENALASMPGVLGDHPVFTSLPDWRLSRLITGPVLIKMQLKRAERDPLEGSLSAIKTILQVDSLSRDE